MWTFLITLIILFIFSLGIIVAIYTEKHHEDVCQFRIVEYNDRYYIQRHQMILGHDGISHSVWEYEEAQNEKAAAFKRYEYDTYIDALEKVRELKAKTKKYQKESFKDYINRKRDNFTIIKYFE